MKTYIYPVNFIKTVYVECDIDCEVYDWEIIELCNAPNFDQISREGWSEITVGIPEEDI